MHNAKHPATDRVEISSILLPLNFELEARSRSMHDSSSFGFGIPSSLLFVLFAVLIRLYSEARAMRDSWPFHPIDARIQTDWNLVLDF